MSDLGKKLLKLLGLYLAGGLSGIVLGLIPFFIGTLIFGVPSGLAAARSVTLIACGVSFFLVASLLLKRGSLPEKSFSFSLWTGRERGAKEEGKRIRFTLSQTFFFALGLTTAAGLIDYLVWSLSKSGII